MCERARALLESGVALEAMAPPRLRVQLALYRLGGDAILDAIAAAGYRTATHRPKVDRGARVRIVARALAATRATSVGATPRRALGSRGEADDQRIWERAMSAKICLREERADKLSKSSTSPLEPHH